MTSAGDMLDAWVRFIQADGKTTYAQWPEFFLREWVRFQAENGQLYFSRRDDEVTGLLVGWQGREEELAWQWHVGRGGNCYLVALLIAHEPEAALALMSRWVARYPDHWSMRLMANRRGRTVAYPPRVLTRFWDAMRRATGERVAKERLCLTCGSNV